MGSGRDKAAACPVSPQRGQGVVGTAGHEQPNPPTESFFMGLRSLSDICLHQRSATFPRGSTQQQTAPWCFPSPASDRENGERRGCSQGRGAGSSQHLQHLPHAHPILTRCSCRAKKGAQHGNALLPGQTHTGKEEKTLERRTGEADSRSPRWRHSLPFSAKCPRESMDLFGT